MFQNARSLITCVCSASCVLEFLFVHQVPWVLLPKFLILSISSNYPILSIGLAQEDIPSVTLALKSLVEVLSIMLILHFGSILSGVQYVNLQKCFLHLSVVIYFFPTLPITKPRLQLGGRLLVSDHLDQSLDQERRLTCCQLETRSSKSYLLHSSLASVRLWSLLCLSPASANYAFYQPQQTVQECWAKCILLSQTSIFWLFFVDDFNLQGWDPWSELCLRVLLSPPSSTSNLAICKVKF